MGLGSGVGLRVGLEVLGLRTKVLLRNRVQTCPPSRADGLLADVDSCEASYNGVYHVTVTPCSLTLRGGGLVGWVGHARAYMPQRCRRVSQILTLPRTIHHAILPSPGTFHSSSEETCASKMSSRVADTHLPWTIHRATRPSPRTSHSSPDEACASKTSPCVADTPYLGQSTMQHVFHLAHPVLLLRPVPRRCRRVSQILTYLGQSTMRHSLHLGHSILLMRPVPRRCRHFWGHCPGSGMAGGWCPGVQIMRSGAGSELHLALGQRGIGTVACPTPGGIRPRGSTFTINPF